MILDKFKLDGKVAVITGANTGLGQSMCIALAEAGADIVGVARRDMTETRKITEKTGRYFFPIIADLGETSSIELIIEETLRNYGKIDILINNAGIIKRQDAIDFSEENWDSVINVNLKAVFFLSQMAAKQFIKQKSGGKIINIASMLSYQGGVRVSSYTASKSAVMGITRSMANEWAKLGINVNAIAPGYMLTNNTKALYDDEKRNREILSRIPAGMWGTPEDIMGAAVFFSSPASDYINGFTLAVDGGWLAR